MKKVLFLLSMYFFLAACNKQPEHAVTSTKNQQTFSKKSGVAYRSKIGTDGKTSVLTLTWNSAGDLFVSKTEENSTSGDDYTTYLLDSTITLTEDSGSYIVNIPTTGPHTWFIPFNNPTELLDISYEGGVPRLHCRCTLSSPLAMGKCTVLTEKKRNGVTIQRCDQLASACEGVCIGYTWLRLGSGQVVGFDNGIYVQANSVNITQ